jgi:hypothetical protein
LPAGLQIRVWDISAAASYEQAQGLTYLHGKSSIVRSPDQAPSPLSPPVNLRALFQPIIYGPLGGPEVSVSGPAHQIVFEGESAAFNTSVNIMWPPGFLTSSFDYQWQKSLDEVNWTNIAGATSNALVLPRVRAEDAGYYRMLVLYDCLYAVSSAARLTVLPRSRLTLELARADGANILLRLTLTGPSGFSYALEQSTNLVQWHPFLNLTNLVIPSHLLLTNDNPSRFLRARVLPSPPPTDH